MVAAVREWAGAPIDILVNNAGVASRGKSVADTDPAEPGHLLAVHAIGPHWLSGLVLPGMREVAARPGGRGDIVFISSVATDHMAGWGAPYNMGKAAMEALAKSLAKEEVRHNIHVNIVAPVSSSARWAGAWPERRAAWATSTNSTRPSPSTMCARLRRSPRWSGSSAGQGRDM